jgi:hypothetical protein
VSAHAEAEHTQHPLAEAAARAAEAAGVRAEALAVHQDRLRGGDGLSVADVIECEAQLLTARRRQHEARRRLVTVQLARAHQAVLGQDLLSAARRLAVHILSEDVRGEPLEP